MHWQIAAATWGIEMKSDSAFYQISKLLNVMMMIMNCCGKTFAEWMPFAPTKQ